MQKIFYSGFDAYLPSCLWLPREEEDEKELFYLELVGPAVVTKAISAGLVEGKKAVVFENKQKVLLSLYKEREWHWKWFKKEKGGFLGHQILLPEMAFPNWDGRLPHVVIGQNKEAAIRNLWRYLQTLDIPIPEGQDLPLLTSLFEKAKEVYGRDNEVFQAIEPLEGFGAAGFVIWWRSELVKILRDFYSRMIKKGAIKLEGREIELSEETLQAFLDYWGDALAQEILNRYKPIYKIGSGLPEIDKKVASLGMTPKPAQREAINALYKAMFHEGRNRLVLCGEQGTGKTFMSLALIGCVPKPMRVLVVCPPHLVSKWAREAKQAIPNVKTFPLNRKDTLAQLEWLRHQSHPQKHEVWVIGRERLKLSASWRPAVGHKKVPTKDGVKEIFTCPRCGSIQYKIRGREVTDLPVLKIEYFKKKKRRCWKCGEPLWQPAEDGPRRWAPAEFIKRKLRGAFDLVVVDECHEYKAQGSAQANAIGALLSASPKALFLTGTLAGGYADDLFYLYFRAFPSQFLREGLKWSSGLRFLEKYGILEEITTEVIGGDNKMSKGSKARKVIKKRPGISPAVLGRFLLPNTVFIRLADMADDLPPYEEYFVSVGEPSEDGGEYLRCLSVYDDIKRRRHSAKAALTIASKFVQVLLNLPDCVRHLENEIWVEIKDPNFDPEEEKAQIIRWELIHKTQIVPGGPLAKERWLADLIRSERQARRKVLVYCTYTGTKDITGRLASVFKEMGIRAAVLPSSIPTSKREEWIKKNAVRVDALICNPKLVETGLDLFDFPTIVFYQPGYRVYTLRQAARRSWRIGQKEPVRVYFLAASDTVQEDAWALIAQKWNVSLTIEGELVTDGFASEMDTSGSLLGELAQKLHKGELGKISAEEVFKSLKRQEARTVTFLTKEEVALADDKVSVEIEATEIAKISTADSRPRTLVVSVARKGKRGKVEWVKMTIKPEDLAKVAESEKQPLQLCLF